MDAFRAFMHAHGDLDRARVLAVLDAEIVLVLDSGDIASKDDSHRADICILHMTRAVSCTLCPRHANVFQSSDSNHKNVAGPESPDAVRPDTTNQSTDLES